MRGPHHRLIRSFALGTSLAVALAIVGPLAVAGAAGTDDEAFATLQVTKATVEVKAKGADDFEEAEDGDEVHAGDTVRTDATGKTTIRYGEKAYTRLDTDTTFKITKLTDDAGNRQVEGTIESGKTWNRTTALTESESFEQTGAEATAAVEGTAYAVICESVGKCVFTGVVDSVSLTGKDGVKKLLSPLDECDSDVGVLCADITKLTPDQLPAWIIENLLLDVAEGFPFPFGAQFVVQDGTIFLVPVDPASPPALAPVIGDDPIACPGGCTETGGLAVAELPDGYEPGDEIRVSPYSYIDFVINIVSGPAGTSVVFVTLPSSGEGSVGDIAIYVGCGGSECDPYEDVEAGQQYAADTVFTFLSYNDGEDSFEVKAVGPDGQESETKEVPLTVSTCPSCEE